MHSHHLAKCHVCHVVMHSHNLGPDVKAALRQIPSLGALDDNQTEGFCAALHGKIIALGVFEQWPDAFSGKVLEGTLLSHTSAESAKSVARRAWRAALLNCLL